MEKSLNILATWFGCGLVPKAPGTVGTLGAIPLVWLFTQLGDFGYMAATLIFTVFAILVAHFYELSHLEEDHDSSRFVLDEVAGFLVTMTWLPFGWATVLAGFVVFRFFDILKPFPISWIDRKILGGVGVVADDLAAGILGNIILQVLFQKGLL